MIDDGLRMKPLHSGLYRPLFGLAKTNTFPPYAIRFFSAPIHRIESRYRLLCQAAGLSRRMSISREIVSLKAERSALADLPWCGAKPRTQEICLREAGTPHHLNGRERSRKRMYSRSICPTALRNPGHRRGKPISLTNLKKSDSPNINLLHQHFQSDDR